MMHVHLLSISFKTPKAAWYLHALLSHLPLNTCILIVQMFCRAPHYNSKFSCAQRLVLSLHWYNIIIGLLTAWYACTHGPQCTPAVTLCTGGHATLTYHAKLAICSH